MAQAGRNQPPVRINGQIIIDQLLRNMELGQFEMGYSVLLPCIFSIYLHPDDYARLSVIQDLIREDARRALAARMDELNGRSSLLGVKRRKGQKNFKIASRDFSIQFFPDTEGTVPPADVEIHSELNEVPQPGYRGTKTTLLDREPTVRETTRRSADKIFAEIRYQDDSGPQVYYMTQNEISIGRGGDDLSVDLPLYSNEEVSREHLRLRRDPVKNQFVIVDKSMNGTWLNGRRLAKGEQALLPERAEIGVAEILTLSFEAKR
jgi:FHA domain-containing protein